MASNWTRRGFLSVSALAAPVPVRAADARKLDAGAATAVITPALGASLGGGMRDNVAVDVHDELHVKALVLDNGNTRIALATIDSCAVPRPILDAAKLLIEKHTGIAAAHVCLSATHTHSAPASGHLFQSPPDPKYNDFLAVRIADAVRLAVKRLKPAEIGWGVGKEPRQLFNRRFFMKPGAVPPDPFGRTTDTVKMNPGQGNPNIVKPAGPIDPDLGMLVVRGTDGSLIAAIGNYGLHYVGGVGGGTVSADYFPVFGQSLKRQAGANTGLAFMTNACSGNINGIDVNAPRTTYGPYEKIREVADMVAAEGLRVWSGIKFERWVELAGSVEEIDLGVRLPTANEVAAAKSRVGENPGNNFEKVEDIYARETVILARDYPSRVKVWLQGLRIGQLGIGTFPGEAFCELGLEVKAKSPFRTTFLVELANGYHGYIPTVEGHKQGGYETWRAKSSHLEVEAAPKMVAAVLRRLKSVAG